MEKTVASSATLTVDAHVDAPWLTHKHGAIDLSKQTERMVDFPSMKQGKLDAAFFALYLSDALQDQLGDKRSWQAIQDQWRSIADQWRCQIIFSGHGDIQEAKQKAADGIVPIFLGLEGGRLIGKDLSRLEWLVNHGVRYLTLTHNRNTIWACSATDTPSKPYLSNFGKEIIEECNHLGILIDVSHAHDETAYLAYAASSKPVIASHSGCRALLNHPRNLPDGLIECIADSGGVIHVPFASRFIGRKAEGIVNHIDHIAQLIGNSEHVGIGSDMDGAAMVDGVESAADWWRVTGEALEKRGYSAEDIARITGENTLRMLEL